MKFLPLTLAMLLASTSALADDGEQQIRNVSKTPDLDTEHAALQMMWFNVPVQRTGDEDIEYVEYVPLIEDIDDFVTIREYARPLIALYQDGHVDMIDEDAGGFFGHGEREMFAALSLDDGDTWKDRNLSLSADMSSIVVDGEAYPGDVYRNFTALAGNKVLAVWGSRYCSSGNPTYSMETEEIEAIFDSEYVDVSHLGVEADCIDDDVDDDDPTQCLYFEDYWHVSGSQGIKDFAEEGYPAAGEVPYGCLWAARGTLELLDDDDEEYDIVWRQAERLTSGVRDVNRIEAACVSGAGCVITWQEDPEGLRPGEGEGPGEGWSGAIAHHETDIWYSYVDMDNFDLVKEDDEDEIIPIADWLEDSEDDGVPKVGVPFSMPVRLTDNAMCQKIGEQETDDPYCYMDFDGSGTEDSCESVVSMLIETPEGPTGEVLMCVAEDGRLMRGNTASTRTRTNLRGYDSTADADEGTDSGWVILAYEESKGLGEEDDEDPDKIDMGKNIWYHTFDMFNPELVSQGMILNQPAIYIDDLLDTSDLIGYDLVADTSASDHTDYDGTVSFRTIEPDPIYSEAGLDDEDLVLYQTEIARRYSQITQPASWAGDSGMVALTMWKQGIVRQGGPADVFARRFLIPDTFDAGADNPFDYANMECAVRQFTLGENPRYVKGLCMSSPMNLSGTTLVDCEATDTTECEAVDFPYDDLLADIDKSLDPGGLPKMTEWRQCQEENQSFSVTSGDGGDVTLFTCDDNDLNDQSWENPWDLSKGHRGFIYGDFIMQMYAWSPNWEANTLGHDNYNLYVRRSFDGGATWTTLPSTSISLPEGAVIPDNVVADGSMSCEWYGIPGALTEYPACFTYGAGDYEQARNLSQLTGTHITVLDPRFAGTDPAFLGDLVKMMVDGELVEGDILYPDDAVNPSVYFATFEEGDTAPIILGEEGDPMDMYYARAINFGDEYELADTVEDGIADVDATDGEFEIFDKLEWHELQAAEAALKANPGGTLFYAIWNQFLEVDVVEQGVHGTILLESDAMVRRTMELGDNGVTLPSGGTGDGGPGPGGGGTPDDPPGGGDGPDDDDDDDEAGPPEDSGPGDDGPGGPPDEDD